MSLITPEIKDNILTDIISIDNDFIELNYDDAFKYNISPNQFAMIIKQFIKMGFLENKGEFMGGGIFITTTLDAHDFLSHGGFYAQEEILKANINKLGLELEALSKELGPNFIEQANKISSIASNIVSFLSLTKII